MLNIRPLLFLLDIINDSKNAFKNQEENGKRKCGQRRRTSLVFAHNKENQSSERCGENHTRLCSEMENRMFSSYIKKRMQNKRKTGKKR